MGKAFAILIVALLIWFWTQHADFNKGKAKAVETMKKEKTIDIINHSRGIQQERIDRVLNNY